MPYGPGGKQYVGGRATSNRRRGGGRGQVYDGRGLRAPQVVLPTLKVEADDPEAVFCPNCQTYIKKHKHAPGGYPINVERGDVQCTGTLASDKNSPPIITGAEAKKKRLVTLVQIAQVTKIDLPTIEAMFMLEYFPKAVAMVHNRRTQRFESLYPVDASLRLIEEQMRIRKGQM